MKRILIGVFTGLACVSAAAWSALPQAHSPQLIRITLSNKLHQPESGRLLLFAIPKKVAEARAKGGKVNSVDTSPFEPEAVAVAAQEVHDLMPGGSVVVDADTMTFPKPFSQLNPDTYDVQAVLDVNHNYNYQGRGAGDVLSAVSSMHLGGNTDSIPTLQLIQVEGARFHPWQAPPFGSEKGREKFQKLLDAAHAHAHEIDFVSPALSAFWGHPIHMRGWVLTPPGYAAHKDEHFPTVYETHGFGGDLDTQSFEAANEWRGMADGEMPPMIWVLLDESSATGTQEFADSVNNGPWGTALTTELIPYLEAHYRMDADVNGRFLTGHSSGGWATLWLQVRYPKIFGGTWSTSPDPSDFHDFTGPDLYAPHANVYYKPDGKPWPLVRANGKVISSIEQFAKLERVLGPYGGQLASFEWVFSPKGPDGRPEQLFNRDTGAVNPVVADYWRKHYDIAYRIQTHWHQLKPDLNGKIHIYVGTADTFYLDGAAHKLKAVLDSLGAKSTIVFRPGKTHFDIYAKGNDRSWLIRKIAWEMYAIARPNSDLKPPKSVTDE